IEVDSIDLGRLFHPHSLEVALIILQQEEGLVADLGPVDCGGGVRLRKIDKKDMSIVIGGIGPDYQLLVSFPRRFHDTLHWSIIRFREVEEIRHPDHLARCAELDRPSLAILRYTDLPNFKSLFRAQSLGRLASVPKIEDLTG